MIRPVGYIIKAFPQLSETFVENERAILEELGVRLAVVSIFRPAPELLGPTSIPESAISYPPGRLRVGAEFLRWAILRPIAVFRSLLRAVRCRSLTLLWGVWRAGWLATQLRRAGVGHVHAHFATESTAAALPAAELLGVPCSFTIHAHEIYLRGRALDVKVLAAAKAVTVCEYNISEMRSRWPSLRRENFELMYMGVDPADFKYRSERPVEGRFRLLSVGRLVPIKGYPLLVDAVGMVRDRGHDVSCEIVGQGPMRDELEQQIAALGLGDAVTLRGRLDPAQVAERLDAAHAFVLPCRIDEHGNRDSMPVAIKEAMASGLPVISTDVAGVPEMVDDSVGRLVVPDDANALADAIEQLIAAPAAERSALGRAARRRVEERFDIRIETAKLKELIGRLSGN